MSVHAFIPSAAAAPSPGATVELDDEESRYLVRVRRLRVGQALELFDGHGGAWAATLIDAGRRARVEVGPALTLVEPPTRILLLGLPDQAAILEALTGASELGATQVVFVACERSQGRVPSPARLDRVLRAAQRQCGRPRPPALLGAPPDEPLDLQRALRHRAELPGVFAWEALRGPNEQPEPQDLAAGLRLLVGPEGGLSQAEAELIRAAGFRALSLGPWILRTATAVVALLAKSQQLGGQSTGLAKTSARSSAAKIRPA
jgi:16S rRNA (uracil1498-N3)-methyltransferase